MRILKNNLHTLKRDLSTGGAHYKSLANWYRGLWSPEKITPPYSHIVQLGDPSLRQISHTVQDEYINSKEINFLIDQLVQVLRKYSLVGIAAPQIGINLRVIAMEFKEELKDNFTPELYKTREMEILPLTVRNSNQNNEYVM